MGSFLQLSVAEGDYGIACDRLTKSPAHRRDMTASFQAPVWHWHASVLGIPRIKRNVNRCQLIYIAEPEVAKYAICCSIYHLFGLYKNLMVRWRDTKKWAVSVRIISFKPISALAMLPAKMPSLQFRKDEASQFKSARYLMCQTFSSQ